MARKTNRCNNIVGIIFLLLYTKSIAVQSKGRLFEDTMNLRKETGIKIGSSKRTLLVQSSNFPLEVLFLRDDDIPQSVASGVADLGVVGENEFVERGEDADIISRLGFSKCRLD